MRSTPIARSWRRTASAPVTIPLLLSNVQLGKQLGVARVLPTHISGELVGRHRLGEVYRKRLEALEHHRVLHHALHLGVQALQHLARSRPRRVEAEMRTAVDTLDSLLFQRRLIGKIRMVTRAC